MAEEPEKAIPLQKLLAAVLPDQANTYVTLVSIIQCLAMGFLINATEKAVSEKTVNLVWGLRAVVALLVILVVWHRYVTSFRYLWEMSWLDTLIPFLMGMVECWIIFSIDPDKTPLVWFVASMIGFEVTVAAAYFNAYRKRKSPFTERLYQSFYNHTDFVSCLVPFIKRYDWRNIRAMIVLLVLSLVFWGIFKRWPNERQDVSFPLVCIVMLLVREVFFGFDVSLKRDKKVGPYFDERSSV